MWLYKKKKIKEISQFPEDTFGFIYKVTHNPSGKIYFGRKNLYHNRKQKLSKRAIALIDGPGRKPKYKVVTKESDWQTYYGSNKTVQNLIKEGKENEFSRQILKLCSSKKLLTYYEAKFLFMNEVLEHPDKYFNDNILGKFYTKDLVS